MTEEPKDCLQCRLISGGGLLAGGAHVVHQSKKVKSYRNIISTIGYALGSLGILRIFALPPFRNKQQKEMKNTAESPEENEYIIGKVPPKLH